MALVYSYIRFSTRKQLEGGSLSRQIEMRDAWIMAHDHTLAQSYEDLGVSGFRGKHKHRKALAAFLRAIEDQKIKPGSILCIENMDRLSREGINEAYQLWLSILNAGVKIMVLKPEPKLYAHSDEDLISFLLPLIYFYSAHIESKNKSERVGREWQKKRERASEQPMSKRRPSWLDLNKDGPPWFTPKPGAQEALKHIFVRTTEGIGQKSMVRELVEKFAPIGRSGHWNGSFIEKILNDPAVLGELHLHSAANEDGERRPTGDIIKGYYPRMISSELWARAQAAKAHRFKHRGPTRHFENLFQGLVTNTIDNGTCHIQTARVYGKKKSSYIQRRLVSWNHLRGLNGACSISFDYLHLEAAILDYLWEIPAAELIGETTNPYAAPLEAKLGELAGIESRLAELQHELENPQRAYRTVLDAVARLELLRTDLRSEIERIRAQAAVHDSQPLHQARSIVEALENAKGEKQHNLRLKLKAILATVIERINLTPYKINPRRTGAEVEVIFSNGTRKQFRIERGKVISAHWSPAQAPDEPTVAIAMNPPSKRHIKR